MRRLAGARRIALKARYAVERARTGVRATLTRRATSLSLDELHRRLELVLTAAYGHPVAIAATDRPGWTRRMLDAFGELRGAGRHEAAATIDGETIRLPDRIASRGDTRRAADRYRLLAIEQAERMIRGTSALAPHGDWLERDLYLLREGAAIDAHIARTYPGMARTLNDERTAALARRPKPSRLTQTERTVEQLLCEALAAAPEATDEASSDPHASLAWARETASRIRLRGDQYRGVPLAPAWGAVPRPTDARAAAIEAARAPMPGPRSNNGTQGASRDDADQESQKSDGSGDEPDAANERPRTKREEHDATAETAETADDATPAPDASSDDAASGIQALVESSSDMLDPRAPETENLPPAIYYDEWNADRRSYARGAAAVRLYDARGADPRWLTQELRDHAATARQIRQQFERLRARRTLLPRQQRGDALDLAACVDATIDRRMGNSPDDRVYLDARAARRGLAISLLIDASGSTNQRVTERWRIIDIEKIALALATQALDTLGDRYAIYAFAGRDASNVKVTVVKDFSESNGETVTRRIAAIDAGGFTRLGAAVRHATRQLAAQSAGHRLLLLLSDGRPNDLDAYQGVYGVEDSRQAILEARRSGVYPYCLTIDQAASEYLPRIFGKTGYTVLQKPEQLPRTLLAVVRGLIRQ